MGDEGDDLVCQWDNCGLSFAEDPQLKDHIINLHIGSAKQANLIAVLQCHCMWFGPGTVKGCEHVGQRMVVVGGGKYI